MRHTSETNYNQYGRLWQHSMLRRCDDFDYTARRLFLLTLTVEGRRPLLGTVVGEDTVMDDCGPRARLAATPLGEAVAEGWYALRERFPQIELYALQLMPDHVHAILFVRDRLPVPLGKVVGVWKSACNRAFRELECCGEVFAVPFVESGDAGRQRETWLAEKRREAAGRVAALRAGGGGTRTTAAAAEQQPTQPHHPPAPVSPPISLGAGPGGPERVVGDAPVVGSCGLGAGPGGPERVVGDAPVAGSCGLGVGPGGPERVVGHEQVRWAAARQQPRIASLAGPKPPQDRHHGLLFTPGFNDRILWRANQLRHWQHYVADNPRRLLLRHLHPALFRVQRDVCYAGLSFAMMGNRFLLDRPEKLQIQCSRSLTPEQVAQEVQRAMAAAERGAVLVSPCISPGEKAVARAVFAARRPLIILLENGFGDFAKPGGRLFDACDEGRLLLIAPWQYHPERRAITRGQCLTLNHYARTICEAHTPAIAREYHPDNR
jgi:hypothetical protein